MHINIRCYFLKEKIDRGELKIEHINTKEMVADALTKPVAANKLELFRNNVGLIDI